MAAITLVTGLLAAAGTKALHLRSISADSLTLRPTRPKLSTERIQIPCRDIIHTATEARRKQYSLEALNLLALWIIVLELCSAGAIQAQPQSNRELGFPSCLQAQLVSGGTVRSNRGIWTTPSVLQFRSGIRMCSARSKCQRTHPWIAPIWCFCTLQCTLCTWCHPIEPAKILCGNPMSHIGMTSTLFGTFFAAQSVYITWFSLLITKAWFDHWSTSGVLKGSCLMVALEIGMGLCREVVMRTMCLQTLM